LRHGQVAGALTGPHCDPFNRVPIAQAMLKNLTPAPNDAQFDAYGVAPLW
jgi:PIN domain nuclease of toxin-antitoxin system